jgi:hypothetical protein
MALRYLSWIAIAIAVGFADTSHAADNGSARCPNGGYISSQLVPNAHVAESIYRAVARNLDPQVFQKYPIVVVTDAGDHWSVYQTNNAPPPKAPRSTVMVTAGGGQLDMEIDKCTGAISHAAFNR